MSVTDGSITGKLSEMTVKIDGTASTSTPILVRDTAGSTVNIALPGPNLGAALVVTTGQLIASTALDAAAANTTGTVMDAGSAKRHCSVVAVGTGTLTGNINLMGSLDNTTFVQIATVALTAAATVAVSSGAGAFRYFRADLSGAAGTGTVTAKIMAS